MPGQGAYPEAHKQRKVYAGDSSIAQKNEKY